LYDGKNAVWKGKNRPATKRGKNKKLLDQLKTGKRQKVTAITKWNAAKEEKRKT